MSQEKTDYAGTTSSSEEVIESLSSNSRSSSSESLKCSDSSSSTSTEKKKCSQPSRNQLKINSKSFDKTNVKNIKRCRKCIIGCVSCNRIKSETESKSSKSRSRSRFISRNRFISRSRSKTRFMSRSKSKSRSRSRSRSKCRSRSRSPRSLRRRHHCCHERRRSPSPVPKKRKYNEPPERRCLGVFGLNVNTTKAQIERIFDKFGPLESVQIVIDAKTGKSRGFCFVYFKCLKDAIAAKRALNGLVLDERKIRVDYSVTERAHTPTPGIYMGKPTRFYSEREYHDKYRESSKCRRKEPIYDRECCRRHIRSHSRCRSRSKSSIRNYSCLRSRH